MSVSCFSALAGTSKTMLTRSTEGGHHLCFLNLGGSVQSFTIMYDFSWRFSWMTFIRLRKFLILHGYFAILKRRQKEETPFSSEQLCICYDAWNFGSHFVATRRVHLRSKANPLMMGDWRDGNNLGPSHHWFTKLTGPGPSPTTRILAMEENRKLSILIA